MNNIKGAVADSMLQDSREPKAEIHLSVEKTEESKEKPDISSFAGKAGSLQGSRYGTQNFGNVKPSMEEVKEQDTESERVPPKEQKPPVPIQ